MTFDHDLRNVDAAVAMTSRIFAVVVHVVSSYSSVGVAAVVAAVAAVAEVAVHGDLVVGKVVEAADCCYPLDYSCSC